jgi:hypothetical protein
MSEEFEGQVTSLVRRRTEAFERGIDPVNRFLAFANGGGIALMFGISPAFLELGRSVYPLMYAAILFAMGILSLGIRLVTDIHIEASILTTLLEDQKQVGTANLPTQKLFERYREGMARRTFMNRIPLRLFSFVLFVVGTFVAIGGVLLMIGE